MTYQQLLASALRYLSLHSHSVYQLRQKLSRKTDDLNLVNQVIEYLLEEKLLDDLAFATSLRDYQLARFRGPLFIKYQLLQKGIAADTISQTLRPISFDDQLSLARQFLDHQFSKLKLPPQKLKQKAFQTLQRRGFDNQVCFVCLDEITKKG